LFFFFERLLLLYAACNEQLSIIENVMATSSFLVAFNPLFQQIACLCSWLGEWQASRSRIGVRVSARQPFDDNQQADGEWAPKTQPSLESLSGNTHACKLWASIQYESVVGIKVVK
jgi:hypothetical protein